MKSDNLFLSVVMPAYNESKNIVSVIREMENVISQRSDVGNHEVIVVDDHSSDDTLQKVRALREENRRVTGIRLSRRNGSHTALRAGISQARGDVVLCISADGQEDPRAIGEMLEKIKSGCHLVWAVRKDRREPFLTKWLAVFAYRLIRWFVNQELSSVNLLNADFFMFSRSVAEAINRCPERNTSLFGLMLWLGFRQEIVNYERRQRLSGASKWSFRSKVKLLADWIIAFSGIPLKGITWIGLSTAGLGFLYALFVIFYSIFVGYPFPGWAATVVLILVLGGTQMAMLGVTGEYLWRNLDETRRRPLFFIEDSTD